MERGRGQGGLKEGRQKGRMTGRKEDRQGRKQEEGYGSYKNANGSSLLACTIHGTAT